MLVTLGLNIDNQVTNKNCQLNLPYNSLLDNLEVHFLLSIKEFQQQDDAAQPGRKSGM